MLTSRPIYYMCISEKFRAANLTFWPGSLPCAWAETHGKIEKHAAKGCVCRVSMLGTRQNIFPLWVSKHLPCALGLPWVSSVRTRQSQQFAKRLMFVVCCCHRHTANKLFVVCLCFAVSLIFGTQRRPRLPCAQYKAHGKVYGTWQSWPFP